MFFTEIALYVRSPQHFYVTQSRELADYLQLFKSIFEALPSQYIGLEIQAGKKIFHLGGEMFNSVRASAGTGGSILPYKDYEVRFSEEILRREFEPKRSFTYYIPQIFQGLISRQINIKKNILLGRIFGNGIEGEVRNGFLTSFTIRSQSEDYFFQNGQTWICRGPMSLFHEIGEKSVFQTEKLSIEEDSKFVYAITARYSYSYEKSIKRVTIDLLNKNGGFGKSSFIFDYGITGSYVDLWNRENKGKINFEYTYYKRPDLIVDCYNSGEKLISPYLVNSRSVVFLEKDSSVRVKEVLLLGQEKVEILRHTSSPVLDGQEDSCISIRDGNFKLNYYKEHNIWEIIFFLEGETCFQARFDKHNHFSFRLFLSEKIIFNSEDW